MMNRNSIYMKLNALVTTMSIFVMGLTPIHSAVADGDQIMCQLSCDLYKNHLSALETDAKCQSNPACRSCVNGVKGNTILPNYCGAMEVQNDAKKAQLTSIITYGAAAAVCTTACVFTWLGGDSWCTGVSIGAGVAEVLAKHWFVSKSERLTNELLGGAMSGVGTAMGANMAGKAMTSAGVGKGAGANQSKNNQSCASAGIMAALAVMKGINKKKMDVGSQLNCENINELNSRDKNLTSCLGKFAPSNQGMAFASGYGHASAATAVDGGPSSSAANAEDLLADEILKSAAKAMKPGYSVADFKKRLEGGEPLSKMLAGIAGSSNPNFEEKFTALEKEIASNMQESLGTQVAGSGSDSTNHGKELNFNEIGFGNSDTGLSRTDSEITISGNRKVASASNDGDIFHSGYGGTIFQIVSQTLVNQKPNVQALEPALPLNRALAGLKNESPANKNKAGKK